MMEKPRLLLKSINGNGNSNGGGGESSRSFPQQQIKNNLRVSADEDTEEISIFDAQRYFSETNNSDAAAARVCTNKRVSPLNNMDHNISISEPRFSSASSSATTTYHQAYGTYGGGGHRNYRVRSFHATPTVSSEASWNSQTGLLSNPPGAIAVSMSTIKKNPDHDRDKIMMKGSVSGSGKFKWLWGRRCPCRGKKSVQVEPKTPLNLNQKSLDTKILSWGVGGDHDHHKREDDHDHDHIRVPCSINNPPQRISADNFQFHNSSLLLGQQQRVVVASSTSTVLPTIRPALRRISADNVSAAGTNSGFTFPILNQQKPSHNSSQIKILGLAAVNINSSNDDHDQEDPPRESLEVFRPLDESSPISFPKKMVSRIITPIDDDVASDTSSDLFEIESFSTSQSTSYPMYHRRDSLDEASNYISSTTRRSSVGYGGGCPYSPMMTECYEPSEASIEWSVTTAEGFERGSVGISEAEETMMAAAAAHGNGGGGGSGKKKSAGNGGGLLSCRCEKAVSVGPNPVKYMPPHRLAHNTSKHVGNVNKPPLAR